MTIQLAVDPALSLLMVGAVEFRDVVVSPSSDELRQWCDSLVRDAVARCESTEHESLRQAVRSLLRFGKFKASGRSKPAHEYLMRCAIDDGKLTVAAVLSALPDPFVARAQ